MKKRPDSLDDGTDYRAGHSERLLRIRTVMGMTGLSRQTINKYKLAGKFPRPIHPLGHCRVAAWLESEVQAWIADRIKAAKP
jgi:prophage regulatory protein